MLVDDQFNLVWAGQTGQSTMAQAVKQIKPLAQPILDQNKPK